MTAADLARIVHASRSGRRNGQLMPSFGPNRNRQSAHDIALRLRLERKLAVTEPEVFALLGELAALGCVARGDGGWGVTDWDRLGEVGAASDCAVPKARKAKR